MRNKKIVILLIALAALGALVFSVFVLPRMFAGSLGIPAVLSMGSIQIRLYGVIQALALVCGYFVFLWLSKSRSTHAAYIYGDALLWIALPAYVFARAYYVLFSWELYSRLPWWHVFAIWEGGLAIHGGILGGALGIWAFARRKKLGFISIADAVVPGLAIGQAIGRWGNFFNQEAFGVPTDLPWKMFVAPEHRPEQFAGSAFFHPTFLYESLWNLFVFVCVTLLYRAYPKVPAGVPLAMYCALYSLGRFAIESLRTDSLYMGEWRVAQLVSVIGVLFGVAFAISIWQRHVKRLRV